MIRRDIYDYFFLGVLGFVLYGILKLLSPFAGPVLAAVICAVTFYPLYQSLRRWLPQHNPILRVAITEFIVFIFFVTPIILLLWAIYEESAALIPALKQGSDTVADLRQGNVSDAIPWIDHVRLFLSSTLGMRRAQFEAHIMASVNQVLQYVSLAGTALASHVIIFLIDLFIMLFTLFFMFRDGEKFMDYFHDMVPMRRESKKRLRVRMRDTIVGVVRGWLLTSFIQGILAIVGYLIVGAEGAVLLGALTAVSGLIPVVGTLGISIPAAIYFFGKGQAFKGGFVLIWGTVIVVGLIDTVVRPYLMGKKAELPMFALFFALLGGVEIWGVKGIILGPLLIGVAPVLMDIYRERYLRQSDYGEEKISVEHASV